MREDNHERRMFYKLIFLMVVSLLIIVVYLWKWTADDPEKQDPEEMFEESSQQDDMKELVSLDEDKINAALKEYGEVQKTNKGNESQQNEETTNNQVEVDFEKDYINQYGKQEVEQSREQAEKVLALYLLQVTDWNKWRDSVTPNYLKKVKKVMTTFKDEKAKRELDDIDLFASQPTENEEITYGAFATWHVTVKGKSTSKPMQLYYINLQKEGDNWIVNDMRTPDNQSMEGEGNAKK